MNPPPPVVIRYYDLTAAEASLARLLEALRGFVADLSLAEGLAGVEILRDEAQKRRFIIIERWHSEAARLAAGNALKPRLKEIMECLDGQPHAAGLTSLYQG